MLKPIRVRLTLWYLVLLLLTLAALSAVLYSLLARSMLQQVDGNLRLNAEQLSAGLNFEHGQLKFESTAADVDAENARGHGYIVQIADAGGKVIDASGPSGPLSITPSVLVAAERGKSSLETRPIEGGTYRIYTKPIREDGHYYGLLQVAQTLDPVYGTLRQLLVVLALIVPVALLLALAGGYWLARRALAPIDRITVAAQQISARDLSQRLDLNLPDDEVGRLARTFDGMLARLDATFRRQRQFTSDASHELRTPLTVMRGELDVALSRPRRAEEYHRVLEALSGEVDHMTGLAEDLLTLARAEEGRLAMRPAALDAQVILAPVVQKLEPLARAAGLALDLRVEAGLAIWGDEAALGRVMTNLVSNAIKYTPRGGRVSVCATRAGSLAALTISDTGQGIPPEHLPHVFERFYRADEARSQNPAGVGLGLSIVESLVHAQGGAIEVASRPGDGTTFIVQLPAVVPQAK